MGILLFVLKYMYISLFLKMINGFSWLANIMVSPFKYKYTLHFHDTMLYYLFIGPCQSNPCQNGGTCIDSSGSSPDPLMDWEVLPAMLAYFCMCPEEWAGTTCTETSKIKVVH